ncbi:hypothetical protein D3C71_1423410 [compost metagenome]
MYFCVVAREMVDSCKPSSPAMSFRINGRMAAGPWLKKAVWRSTMAWDTRRIVSKRCSTLRIIHLACCNWACRPACADSFWLPSIWAYSPLICRRGTAALLSVTCQPRRVLRTMTSGTAYSAAGTVQARPGRGSRRRISECAARNVASSQPTAAHKRAEFPVASSGRCCAQICLAQASTAASDASGRRAGSGLRNCSCRHSAMSRAPMPTGSNDCSRESAARNSSISGSSSAGSQPRISSSGEPR